MRHLLGFALFFAISGVAVGQRQVLWWTTPAPKWDQATPIGNGRIGAMVFDGAAGIAGMLLQSHTDEIVLLPALPKQWPTGSAKGVRARGGYTVDMAWAGGKITSAAITADRAGKCRVRSGEKVRELEFKADGKQELPRDEN